MQPWNVTWNCCIYEIDFEINSNIEADSATQALKKFIDFLEKKFPGLSFENQEFRVEKNYTYFLFKIKNNLLQRI